MNDITALMATMKAAAEKAKHAGQAPVMPFDTRITALNEFQLAACPANVMTLVEALEKAQRANTAQDDHINQQQDRIDILEKRDAELGKHVGTLEKRLRGTEESLIASVDVVRELESRTVTVKLPLESLPKTEKFWSVIFDLLYQTSRKDSDNWNVSLSFSEAKEFAAWLNEVMPFRGAGIQVIEGEQKNG